MWYKLVEDAGSHLKGLVEGVGVVEGLVVQLRVVSQCTLRKVLLPLYLRNAPAVEVVDDGLSDGQVF